MPQIGFNPEQEQRFQENRRLGSQLLTIGWILMAMGAIGGLFVFQDIREGTHMWLIATAVIGIVALILIALGTLKRRQIYG